MKKINVLVENSFRGYNESSNSIMEISLQSKNLNLQKVIPIVNTFDFKFNTLEINIKKLLIEVT